ncbi:MAG: metal ABC transporter solute-binding protein, Zn/Mn family [Acidithiobacillus sp.]
MIPFNHQKAWFRSIPNHCLRNRVPILMPLIALFAGLGMAQVVVAATIHAVGIENAYANVIGQIGGEYVTVSAIESNPDTDPHTFEASPAVAREMVGAQIVVRNGIGYDSWAKKILAADPNPKRKVIVVQDLLHLPENTKNPHLWYKPETMPAVAEAVAQRLTELDPARAAYFAANVRKFDAALKPWYQVIARFKARFGGTPVAVTEPVADYLLQAAGCDIKTPWNLQAAIMNGTDPAPQDVSIQNQLIKHHQIKIFVYNQQVTDSLTASFLSKAKAENIPVVGVYETMPRGYSYQSWMLAEANALRNAVERGMSTTVLK